MLTFGWIFTVVVGGGGGVGLFAVVARKRFDVAPVGVERLESRRRSYDIYINS